MQKCSNKESKSRKLWKVQYIFSEFWILCSVDRAPVLHEEYSQL